MSVKDGTPMMIARAKYHAVRSVETAKAYADAAIVETDFGTPSRAAVLIAVAAELSVAKFADDALRCVAASDEAVADYVKSRKAAQ